MPANAETEISIITTNRTNFFILPPMRLDFFELSVLCPHCAEKYIFRSSNHEENIDAVKMLKTKFIEDYGTHLKECK